MSGEADFTQSARASWLEIRPDDDMTNFDLGMRVRRLALILHDRLDQAVTRHGFSMFGDYEVVASIRREGRPLQPSEIADHLMVTRAGVTGRLNRLERQGFIKRAHAKADARSVLVSITPLGRRRVDAAFEAMHDDRADIFKPLTDAEQRHLAEILRRVLTPIDEPATPSAVR